MPTRMFTPGRRSTSVEKLLRPGGTGTNRVGERDRSEAERVEVVLRHVELVGDRHLERVARRGREVLEDDRVRKRRHAVDETARSARADLVVRIVRDVEGTRRRLFFGLQGTVDRTRGRSG